MTNKALGRAWDQWLCYLCDSYLVGGPSAFRFDERNTMNIERLHELHKQIAIVTPCEWTPVGHDGFKTGCGKAEARIVSLTYWIRLYGAVFCPFCGHPIKERHVEESK